MQAYLQSFLRNPDQDLDTFLQNIQTNYDIASARAVDGLRSPTGDQTSQAPVPTGPQVRWGGGFAVIRTAGGAASAC